MGELSHLSSITDGFAAEPSELSAEGVGSGRTAHGVQRLLSLACWSHDNQEEDAAG